MSRRVFQYLFGLAVGLGARLFLPGHSSVSLVTAGALSLAGALAGGLLAEHFLPFDGLKEAEFLVAALGAITMLLIYGVAVQ